VQFVEKNIWMIVIAVLSGLMLVWSFLGNRIRGIKDVSCAEALQMINRKNALVLDIREESEYKTGHILKAKNIPIADIKERVGELERYRSQPIVVMCRAGTRSPMACTTLTKLGFTEVYNLSGGMMAWKKSTMPVNAMPGKK